MYGPSSDRTDAPYDRRSDTAMKKIALLLAALATALGSPAQVRVESPHPDLGFSVKRCMAYGRNSVVLDVVVTNYTDEDQRLYWASDDTSVAYDDEGDAHVVRIDDPDDITAVFPPEVPVRVRFRIDGVSRYATSLPAVRIGITGALWGGSYGTFRPQQLRLSDVPIRRE